MFDDKGVSLLTINNEKGSKIWDAVKENFICKVSDMTSAFTKNHIAASPFRLERLEIFDKLDQKPIDDLLLEYNDIKHQETNQS